MKHVIEVRGKSIVGFELIIHKSSITAVENEIDQFIRDSIIFKERPIIIKADRETNGLAAIVAKKLADNGFHPIDMQIKTNLSLKPNHSIHQTTSLNKTIRSGQIIEADGDFVLFGNLNSGGQIKASGNIIILGQNKGTVHAGSKGNREALIFSTRLLSPQIRIADRVAKSPEEKKSETGPEIAFLSSSGIIVQSYEEWLMTNKILHTEVGK